MDLIVILSLAFLLFAFVAIMYKPQRKSIDKFMERGQDVKPLLKEKSAFIKYSTLHDSLLHDDEKLQKLEGLQKAYQEGIINVNAYSQMLDEMNGQSVTQ